VLERKFTDKFTNIN